VGSIAKIFPPFADYFLEHQRLASFVTNTVPVILVASISLSICPLLLVVANKAETLVTGYDVHNAVIHRFWIFQMVSNVVCGLDPFALATDLLLDRSTSSSSLSLAGLRSKHISPLDSDLRTF